jgi:hypothetical protein
MKECRGTSVRACEIVASRETMTRYGTLTADSRERHTNLTQPQSKHNLTQIRHRHNTITTLTQLKGTRGMKSTLYNENLVSHKKGAWTFSPVAQATNFRWAGPGVKILDGPGAISNVDVHPTIYYDRSARENRQTYSQSQPSKEIHFVLNNQNCTVVIFRINTFSCFFRLLGISTLTWRPTLPLPAFYIFSSVVPAVLG